MCRRHFKCGEAIDIIAHEILYSHAHFSLEPHPFSVNDPRGSVFYQEARKEQVVSQADIATGKFRPKLF